MNHVTVDGIPLAFQLDGRVDGPPLVLINSVGTDMGMWEAQAAALGDRFRILRYDARGHGASGVPDAPATLDRLGRDLLALLDHVGLDRAHVCGLSLGGLTAQWLVVHHPARVKRLVLSNTAARIGSVESWSARITAVAAGGMDAIAETVLARFFSPAFRAAHPATVRHFEATLRAIDPAGYRACCAALRDADLRALVGAIVAPTLVIAGALDEATPPAQATALHEAIVGSKLVVFPEVGHLSNVEQPEAFTAELLQFLHAST